MHSPIIREFAKPAWEPGSSEAPAFYGCRMFSPRYNAAPRSKQPTKTKPAPGKTENTDAGKTRIVMDTLIQTETKSNEIEALAALGEKPPRWEAPEPLPDAAEPPLEFNVNELMPEAFAGYVADNARRLSCPPDMVALPLMVAAGASLGRGISIRPKRRDGWTEFANLWGAIIAPPSSGKSPALDVATKPLRAIEAEGREGFAERLAEHKDALFTHDATMKAARAAVEKAARAGEDLSNFQMPPAPLAPIERRTIVTTATPEKLVQIHADNPRGLLVLRDELTGWLRLLDRAGRESERALFLEGWTAKNPYRSETVGRGSDFIKAACLAVYGGIQPGPFKEYLQAPEHAGRADGMLQRFSLLAWPEQKEFKLCDDLPDTAAAAEVEKTFRQLAALNDDIPEGEEPPFLRFAEDAQGSFLAWLESFMNRIADIRPESFQGHLSKYRKALPALALICELAANPNAAAVSLQAWNKALAWGDYLESHLRKIYAPSIRTDITAAEKILERLDELGSEFTTRELYKKDWAGLTELDTVRAALDLLARHGWIAAIDEAPRPGRPSEQWQVNPQAGRHDA